MMKYDALDSNPTLALVETWNGDVTKTFKSIKEDLFTYSGIMSFDL